MAELIWDGKYDEHGNKRAPVRIELPFQTVETVNESVQERQRTLELSSSGNDPEWRNRLIWGDKKYVLIGGLLGIADPKLRETSSAFGKASSHLASRTPKP